MKAHSRGASVPFGLSHIARYAPSPEGNICAPIMHFQCKNNFEHLLTIWFDIKVKCCKGNTKALYPTKKVYNLYTNIYSLPVCLLINECVCFYCHLTLFVRNKSIHRCFKSVRYVQSIIHALAYILHNSLRCRAADLDVCSGLYGIGTQRNLSEQQTFLLPYAVILFSRACAVWQRVGCVGCV